MDLYQCYGYFNLNGAISTFCSLEVMISAEAFRNHTREYIIKNYPSAKDINIQVSAIDPDNKRHISNFLKSKGY